MQNDHLIHKNPIRYSCNFPAVYAEVSKNEIIIEELLLVILMFCFFCFGGGGGVENKSTYVKQSVNEQNHRF